MSETDKEQEESCVQTEELIETFRFLMKKHHLKGEYDSFQTVKSGNINDTYVLHTRIPNGEMRSYVVQRINHTVFRKPEQVAKNAAAVTSHIEQKLRAMGVQDLNRHVLHYYPNQEGLFFTQQGNGNFWRVFSYVPDSISVDTADDDILRSTGVAFGRFQRYLSDFPAGDLYETIPAFHNTPKRFLDLSASAWSDPCGRAGAVREELNYLFSMRRYVSLFEDLQMDGTLRTRVVHNDTKCNNVMFDRVTKEPLAVIDLDTVMPGLVAYDFGDAVRFACNEAAEDAEDLAAVSLRLEGFRCFAEGFVGQLRGILTEAELNTLPEGVLVVTLELAARFLKDYLDGDVYFKCSKEKHNLHRARCQIALAKDVKMKLPEMHRLLYEVTKQG